jgi:hypothetical protein
MRTGRLIGIMPDDGARIERCSAAGVRASPISLRSGAVRGPRPLRRWQLPQAPLPSKMARPLAAEPMRTVLVRSKPARMYAMMPASSAGCSANGGIPEPGTPRVTTRARSSSLDERRNRPRRRSTPGTMSPLAPWHCEH